MQLLKRVTLIGLATVVIAGLLVYRDYTSPRKTWLRTIQNPDRASRVAAWMRLQREHEIRGLDRVETIREVFASLDDPDPGTRLLAVSTVPMIDVDPLLAISKLAGRLKDSDAEIRARAASTIGDVFRRNAPGRDEALAAISLAFKDPEATVRAAGLSALGQVIYSGGKGVDPLRSGNGDDPALGLAVSLLQDPEIKVRVEAAYVLACNDRGAEAEPMLEEFLRSQPASEPPAHVADRAFLAMMVLAIQSDRAAAFLCGQMAEAREGYPERPRDALAWAAKQSPEARLRVKRLASTLLDPANPSLRHNAGLLLHQIGSDQLAIPVLIEALNDSSLAVRIMAVEALGDIGGIDPAIFTALETATYDSNREVRERASAALEAIEWAEILSEIEGTP